MSSKITVCPIAYALSQKREVFPKLSGFYIGVLDVCAVSRTQLPKDTVHRAKIPFVCDFLTLIDLFAFTSSFSFFFIFPLAFCNLALTIFCVMHFWFSLALFLPFTNFLTMDESFSDFSQPRCIMDSHLSLNGFRMFL